MAIFLIFMILTGLVVFITWYIVTKDKRKAKKRKIQEIQEIEDPSLQENTHNIKTIWGIKEVRDGIMHLKDDKYAAAVKMGSLDIGLLSSEEQESVENALIRLALSLNFPVRLYSTTDYVDTSATQRVIQKALMTKNFSAKLRTYAESTLKYLEDMRKTRSVYIRENFFVIFYEGELEKAYKELDRRCQIIIASLKRLNVAAKRVTSDEIINVLHNALNKRSSAKPSEMVEQGAFELYVTGSGKVLEEEDEENEAI